MSEVKLLSRVQLFVIPWTIAYQAPPSMEFPRQEYWSRLPFPSPGIFPTQGSNPGLPHCRQTLYLLSYQGSPDHQVSSHHYFSKEITQVQRDWQAVKVPQVGEFT